MATIKVSENFDCETALAFSDQLLNGREIQESISKSEDLDIDFSGLAFCDSCGALIFAQALSRAYSYTNGLIRINIIGGNTPAFHYMNYMGAFGGNGAAPKSYPNTLNYIPINLINKDALIQGAFVHHGEILDQKGLEIAKVILRQPDKQLEEVLQYCLREIMRNVYEHAESSIIGYNAQYYPQRKVVEMTILDDGQGLLKSLKNNPFLNISTNRAAVCAAFLPGISGKMYKGVKIRRNDDWQNSGFGLYMLRRFAERCGKILLFTNDYGIMVEGHNMQEVTGYHKGTLVYFQIDTDKIGNLATLLSDFREDGERKARELRGEEVTASTASVMLSSQINSNRS